MTAHDGFYIETIHKAYEGYDDPVFFNKDDFPWVKELEDSYDEIMTCLSPIFEEGYNDLTINPETHLQFPKKGWKTLVFCFYGIQIRSNLKKFPFLAEKLAKIPNMICASISMLEPGTKVLPHNGNTNAIMRVHLALKIPAKYPECGMVIEDHAFSWEEGKAFMFCNMKMHHVQNLTSQRRFVLILDVMRPEFVHLKKKVCGHTMARVLTNGILDIGRSIVGLI